MQTDDSHTPLHAWSENIPVPLEHPELSGGIRQAVSELWQPGDNFHRIVTENGVEWWLLNSNGELIEAFWLE